MNGGEPLYLYSNFFLWAEFVVFSLLNFIFGLPTVHLINVYTCFVVVSFSTYCLLLFRHVLGDKVASFFAFSAVLLGGLMTSTLTQFMLSPFYLFPLAFLSLYLFLTRRRWIFVISVVFFTAVSANHYIPNYLILTLLVFLAAAAIVLQISRWFGRSLVEPFRRIHPDGVPRINRPSDTALSSTLFLCAIAALGPAFFVFLRIRDLISPVRGNLSLGEHGIGLQPVADIGLSQFKFLLWIPHIVPGLATHENLIYAHSPFLVGIIVILFALASPVAWRSRYYFVWLLSTIGVTLFGLGSAFPPWVFLRDHVPFFYVRHAYPLSIPITLLLVILAGFGFKKLCRSYWEKVSICGASIVLCLLQVGHGTVGDRRTSEPLIESAFRYPLTRTPYTLQSSEVPIDAMPILTKAASATNASDDYVLFRTKEYQSLVENNLPLLSGTIFGYSRSDPQDDRVTSYTPSTEPNELENGSFNAWYPTKTLSGRPAEAPRGFRILPEAEEILVSRSHLDRMPDGAPSGMRVDLSVGRPMLIIIQDIPDVERLRGQFLEAQLCLSSTEARRISVELQLAEKDGKIARSPRTVTLSARTECRHTTFYVLPTTTALTFNTTIYSPAPVSIDVSQVSLKVIPAMKETEPAVPVEIVRGANPNHIGLQIDAPAKGFLTRKENYDSGWTAIVNGISTPIEKWGALQAIPVSAGKNTIELTYRSAYPTLFWIHVITTLIGYVMFFIALVREPVINEEIPGSTGSTR